MWDAHPAEEGAVPVKPSRDFEPLSPASSVILRAALLKHLLHIYLTKSLQLPVAPGAVQPDSQGAA